MKPVSQNWALKVSTLIVVTACFVVMSFVLVFTSNFKSLLTLWGEEVQLTVYLNADTSEKGRDFVIEKLKATGKAGEIELITQEKALGDFRAQLASYAPEISRDEELLKLIPASLQVKLASDVAIENQTQTLQNLAAEAKKIEGVEDVTYGQDWVAKYATLVSVIQKALQGLGLIVVFAALFVISNAVRASVQNRKEEIIVMEMVGATSRMIRKPFLIEGALLGVVASTLAALFCFGIFSFLKNLVVTQLSFLRLGEHLAFMSVPVLVAFIVSGGVLGSVASYMCVRRLNDGFAGSQG